MKQRYRFSFLVLATLAAMPGVARAQSTNWTAASGDWGIGSNWSAGEPTAGVDALITTTSTVMVTLAGETCRSLQLGSSGGALLEILSGSLTVENATIGLASPNIGASAATRPTGNPVFTVTRSLTIGPFADFVAGGGTITIGTTSADSLVVRGTLQLMNTPATTARNLAMRDQSVLSATVTQIGFSGVVVTGTAVLKGTLKVIDSLAPDGNYEVIRAGSIVGTFSAAQLPSTGSWSWRIEGNSVFVTKGVVPVEEVTWGEIKAR